MSQTGSGDEDENRKLSTGSSKSPVDLTIEFLSDENLDEMVENIIKLVFFFTDDWTNEMPQAVFKSSLTLWGKPSGLYYKHILTIVSDDCK